MTMFYARPTLHRAYRTRTSDAYRGTNAKSVPANILEREDHFEVELFVPGFTRDQIKVTHEKNELIVTGTIGDAEEDANYLLRQFKPESFERRFELGEMVDTEAIKAKVEQGILSITLLKKAEPEPLTIEVN